LGFNLGDAHGELHALAVDLPRLGLHLAKGLRVAVGALGAPLSCRVQGPVEPPPLVLNLPLKGTQRLKAFELFAIASHQPYVPFLFLLHPHGGHGNLFLVKLGAVAPTRRARGHGGDVRAYRRCNATKTKTNTKRGGGESGAMRLYLPLSPCQPWGEKSGWRWSYGGEDQEQNMAIDARLHQSWCT
jgi:hypothetical protein